MYKNNEDLFEAIKGDWNYEGRNIESYFFISDHCITMEANSKNGYWHKDDVSLADIFADLEPLNACECLAVIKNFKKECCFDEIKSCTPAKMLGSCTHSKYCKEYIIKLEAELRQKIFESKDKLKAINEFMGK